MTVYATCLSAEPSLSRMFGMIIRGMAYPDSGITRFENGADYADIKHYLKDLGIVYSRTLGGDNDSFALPTDWHAWMPTAHHTNPELFSYIDEFLNEPMPLLQRVSNSRTFLPLGAQL